VIRLGDNGLTGEEEVGFWDKYGDQAEIRTIMGAQPEVIKEMLVARFRDSRIDEWP
jgi:hypothetical protein